MTTQFGTLHIAAEVDVSGEVWAGVADYQGAPHLFLAELLDLDQPQARRRLGQTFLLIAVAQRDYRAILSAWDTSLPSGDGDRRWKRKQIKWESAWAALKRQYVRQADAAWRVRGSFRQPGGRDDDVNVVRWTLLRKTPVSGDHVRARLASIEVLVAKLYGNQNPSPAGDDEPF